MRNDAAPSERLKQYAYRLHAAVIALALPLSACLSLAPQYERPALPVAPAWPTDAPNPGRSTAADVAWRDYFPDPQLQALIAQALEHNRDLRIAVQRVEEARAAYGVRRADQLPTVQAGGSTIRFRTPAGILGSQPINGTGYSVSLTESNWELDFWGRVRNLKDAALENYLASEASRRAATLALIAQVADAYLLLREFDERIAIARQTIATRTESLRIVRRRYEVGATPKLDLTQSQILLEQARTLAARLQQQRANDAHALDVLVGSPTALSPPTRLDDNSIRADLGAGLPSQLLENRPDILAAEHQLRAAAANIGAARAAFFPRITLTGALGTSSTSLQDLFSSNTGAWIFLPSVSLPVFDAGRNRSNLALEEARRREALAQYEKSIQSAFRDVADALSARAWLADQVQSARASLDAQTERARLARLRYDSGATPFLEVLDAQRDLLDAQQSLVQTRRALLSSRVALYCALGGDLEHEARAGQWPSIAGHSTSQDPSQ